MQPKQFKLKQDSYRHARKKYLLFFIPLMMLAIAAGLAISHFNLADDRNDTSSLFIALPLALLLMVPSVLKSLKRQKELFYSYTLRIEDNLIIREQKNTPTIELSFLQIKEILRMPDGSFCIKSFNKASDIYVPRKIEGYPELETLLGSISPIEQKQLATLMYKYGKLLILPVLGSMVAVFISQNAVVVTTCGTLLMAFLVWALQEGRRSKSIDAKTKKGLWWIVVLLLAVMGRIAMSLIPNL